MTTFREKTVAAVSAFAPVTAWAAPVPVEPLALMIGGGVSFGLGGLFGLWVCRKWCEKRDRREDKDRLVR